MDRYNQKEMSEKIQIMRAELSIPNIKAPDKINDIITLVTNEDLTKYPPDQLLDYAVKLTCYGLFLTHETNKIEAKIQWCELNIKNIVGKELLNSRGFTFQEKDSDIRANHNLASQLEEQKLIEETKLKTIKFLAQKIQSVSDSLSMLAKERNNVRKISS